MATKIIKALWISSREIAVIFNRDIAYIPEAEIDGASFLPPFSVVRGKPSTFAKFSSYCISGDEVCFVLNADFCDNVRKSVDVDYYVCGDFNGWNASIGRPEWKMARLPDGSRELRVKLSQLAMKRRFGFFKFAAADGRWLEPPPWAPNFERDKSGNSNLRLSLDKTGLHIFAVEFEGVCSLSENISVRFPQLGLESKVGAAEMLLELYTSAKLGARYFGGKTYFSLFAPRATAAYVSLENSDGSERVVEAVSHDSLVWTAFADGDLSGARYWWRVDGRNFDNSSAFDVRTKIADPYANAMVSSDGASIVVFDENLPCAKRNFKAPKWHDLVIVEAHLRDVLANAFADLTSKERLTFSGLSKWLADPACYLRATGANCVELQPIQEFTAANYADYEWGYMPVNWFAPASSYADNPETASQCADFAKLVDAFHAAGLAVVLDVVYNHVGEPNFLVRADKEYYFETNLSGDLMNYSGCGNDFRAKSPMSKRMILDSLKKLLCVYGIDGFRFDLAELLGVSVLADIEIELKKVKPDVILIAEPWSFRGHAAAALRDTGYASWNDGFREFMLSFALGRGDYEGFKYFVSGSRDVARFGAQTVNYLESHDDRCLFDRISGNHENPSFDDLRRYKIANALVLLSIGIPMLAEGFDLVRTKNGRNNTYKDGATNALDYMRGARFAGVCDWLRNLVKFRLSERGAALRRDGALPEGFLKFYRDDNSSAAAVMFNALKSEDSPRIFAAFNPSDRYAKIAVDIEISESFVQIADIDRFDIRGLTNPAPLTECGTLSVPPLSLYIGIAK